MQSLWKETIPEPKSFSPLGGDVKTDVLIVGAGLAGLLTAHRLVESGVKCLVLEAKTVGSGVTQNTTAKITAQHGLLYAKLLRQRGLEMARLYWEANTRAIDDYRRLSMRYPCDLEDQTAYIYSTDDRSALECEAAAYRQLGIPSDIIDYPTLPLPTVGALTMRGQAQFHPLKLLYALAEALTSNSDRAALVHEHTPVLEIQGQMAVTPYGRVYARQIVLATHYPTINLKGLYFLKLYQHRSYVIALDAGWTPDGVYLDAREDGYSFRGHQGLLLVGGGDHKTGKQGGKLDSIRELTQKAFPNAAERHIWLAQDCMSLDGVPYIGHHNRRDRSLLVATGFNKWGMTSSMVAARLLCDLIVDGRSELEVLYAPWRSILHPQLLANIGGATAGLLSLGGPRCTHMGCKLHWNSLEQTWDCACHGSRFTKNGAIIDNPAQRSLKP